MERGASIRAVRDADKPWYAGFLPPRQSYDHRIREAICESRDPGLFPELNIPNSTIRSWLHRGVPDVVTSEVIVREHSELLAENRALQRTGIFPLRAKLL